MSLPIGIDLGTTNSVISVYRRGRPEALLVDGSASVPSAVCFRDKRTTLVGTKALGMAMIRPESTILHVKRKMGDRGAKYTIEGKDHTPVDISSMILEKLCEGHEDELGGAPTHAVITVPAYFTDEQRKDTKLAGEKAGLNVLRLLPEPTAAAIAIGLDKGRDQTILVYDLGGGTFDVSILKVEKNEFTVLAVNGDHDLGGNDFDAALREYALDKFEKQTKLDLRKNGLLERLKRKYIDPSKEEFQDPELRNAVQALTTACERVKMELSEAEEAFLDLPNFYQGHHLEASIDRRTFEGLIKDKVYGTKELVLKTIGEANLDVDDIDRLILVGGSTKIPLVGRVLTDTVKEPYVADNVDLVVSAGASIMAANLFAIQEGGGSAADGYAPVEVKVTDVVAHPISVGMNDEQNRMRCQIVIQKNEALPTAGMTVGAAMPGQRIGQLPIYRGPSELLEENEYLGLLTLNFDASRDPTVIRFELVLDESGVLIVEGAIIDVAAAIAAGKISDMAELQFIDPESLPVKRRTRATIQIPN
jgi:molecular chaperone DnaK (HSP70)